MTDATKAIIEAAAKAMRGELMRDDSHVSTHDDFARAAIRAALPGVVDRLVSGSGHKLKAATEFFVRAEADRLLAELGEP